MKPVTLFLCGDVMTGRGVDQILPHPCESGLHEPHVKDARDYVRLAEAASGPVPRPVEFPYVWGDALAALDRVAPEARIVNLETSVTRSEEHWPGKGIHYRMSPANVPCLTAARIDCCTLANNHVLDWGYPGLVETLETLRHAGLKIAGAGYDLPGATAPVILEPREGTRVLNFARGSESSGIPAAWRASENQLGLALLDETSQESLSRLCDDVHAWKRPGDIVVVSVHWGGNWRYEIPRARRDAAQRLIDEAGADVVHGHSSHHVQGIEVYKEKLILYGCGDFLNDYEGIGGREVYLADLGLMYFPRLDPATGNLRYLEMVPTRIERMQVRHASATDARRLQEALNREGEKFGTSVERSNDSLALCWGS